MSAMSSIVNPTGNALGANTRRLHSVGIDVGTTTTQVIFSALEVTNRAPVNQVPRYEFSGREILYQSPVIFTPLTTDRKVDVAQLMTFIDAQYAAAGLARSQIESGAIIITGETSKTRNARATIMQPAMILADEPTGNLDRSTGEEVMRLLEALNQTGVTLIVVTHDEDLAAHCDRRIAIRDGLITTPEEAAA